MNIRIKDKETGSIWVVQCVEFGLSSKNRYISLLMPDGFSDMMSTEPLKSIDTLNYDAWTKQLEESGHLDLSNSGYEFEDIEEDNE